MARMIFVVGGKHCGTTLTATIMGSNSKCFLVPTETGAYSKRHIRHTRQPFVNQVRNHPAEIIVEKTPDHVYQIDKIIEDWPEAPVFIVTRNPVDRVASTLRRHGNIGQSMYECKSDLVACLNASMRPNTYVVAYESIVKNFNNTVSSMCRFAGLDFEKSMIDFHENPAVWFEHHYDDDHSRLRARQMKTPLYDDSGWGSSYLTQEQVDQVMFDCSEDYERLLCRHREQTLLY